MKNNRPNDPSKATASKEVEQLQRQVKIAINKLYKTEEAQEAAKTIQRKARHYLNQNQIENKAAATIQSLQRQVKAKTQTKDMKQKRDASMLLQKTFRQHIQRQLFNSKIKAAVLIQSRIRRFLVLSKKNEWVKYTASRVSDSRYTYNNMTRNKKGEIENCQEVEEIQFIPGTNTIKGKRTYVGNIEFENGKLVKCNTLKTAEGQNEKRVEKMLGNIEFSKGEPVSCNSLVINLPRTRVACSGVTGINSNLDSFFARKIEIFNRKKHTPNTVHEEAQYGNGKIQSSKKTRKILGHCETEYIGNLVHKEDGTLGGVHVLSEITNTPEGQTKTEYIKPIFENGKNEKIVSCETVIVCDENGETRIKGYSHKEKI